MREKLNNNARAVLEVVLASAVRHAHPTVQEIYEEVRRVRPQIGLATVYRILHQLVAQGMIKEIGVNGDFCRYDGQVDRHDHAICTSCGALLDVPVEVLVSAEALQTAAQSIGMLMKSHEVRFYGLCPSCQQL
jgi:Fur family peroxide stress response transcriptional regulator